MNRKGLAVGLILLLIGISVFPITAQNIKKSSQPTSRGNWLYVGGSGPGNYTKIQDAINASSDGDTVFVFDESAPYYESLIINKSITLLGEEKTTTILNGSSQIKEVVFITVDHVRLSGFTIINYGDEAILVRANYTQITQNILGPKISDGWSGQGIRLFYANHSLVEDNEISHMFESIQIHYSHNNTVRNNHLNSSWLYGIWLAAATYNEVAGNVVDTGYPVDMAGSYVGIRLTSAANNTVVNNTILSRDDACVSGMTLWESDNNTITGNRFTSCGFDWYESYENTLNDNTVNNKPLVSLIDQPNLMITNAGQVILLRCPNSTIQNVTIQNTPKGIALIESDNCHITNCTCFNNSYGIYTDSSENTQITGNVIKNNEHGIYLEAGSAHTNIIGNRVQNSLYIGIFSNAATLNIKQNLVCDNSVGIMIAGILAIKNNIISNNVTRNWDGIDLVSISTTVTQNSIKDNTNGIHIIGGSIGNHILSNDVSKNVCGINISHEPQTLWSFCNWIQKNNFIGNTRHVSFDSSLNNHFRRNYWEGDRIPPHRIDGTLSLYKIHPWTGGIIWEKHIPWMDFDLMPAMKPYTIE
jgi:parallel beta-helix repeat protein